MYNPDFLFNVLQQRGITHRTVMSYLGKKRVHSLKQHIGLDPKASTLEKLADFLNLPIDAFFDRPTNGNGGVVVSGVGNRAVNIRVNSPEGQIELIQALLTEKDKRIATLEELVAALRNKMGQNKD